MITLFFILDLNNSQSSNSSQGVPSLNSLGMGMSGMNPGMNSNLPINNMAAMNAMSNMGGNTMASMQQMSNMNAMQNNMAGMGAMGMNTGMSAMGMASAASSLVSGMSGAGGMSTTAAMGLGQGMLGSSTNMATGFSGGNNFGGGSLSRGDFNNMNSNSNFSGRNIVQISNVSLSYFYLDGIGYILKFYFLCHLIYFI